MSTEEWRAIPGLPRYEASSLGRIRSWVPWKGTPVPRILRVGISGEGYEIVRPTSGGKQRSRNVHALVALTFLGPRPEGAEVCHWNGDKRDNTVGNLRYAPKSENAADSLRHGTHYPGSLTICKRGHPLAGPNLYVYPATGKRMCRECRRIRLRKSVGAS